MASRTGGRRSRSGLHLGWSRGRAVSPSTNDSVLRKTVGAAISGESLAHSDASTVEASPVVTREESRASQWRPVPAGAAGASRPTHRGEKEAGRVWVASTHLKPGDLLADNNDHDVRRLPFPEELCLLASPTPLSTTTTTTTTVGSIFGGNVSSSSSSSSSSSPSHTFPANVLEKLQVALSTAALAPRTPGSSTGQYTAPPSTNRSTQASLIPPSPAALASLSPAVRPSSPRRLRPTRTPRPFASLLTDARRVSRRRKSNCDDDGRMVKDSRAVASSNFFSSPKATPTNASPSSPRLASSLNPWGGGTPGGKPRKMGRTRSMISSTFSRMSPWVRWMSPRAAMPPTAARRGDHPAKSTVQSASPRTPAAAPPSPTGDSPLEKDMDSSSVSVSCGPSRTVDDFMTISPSASRPHQRELASLGAAAAARRGRNLVFSLDLDVGGDEEEEEEKGDKESWKRRQQSRQSTRSSLAAFFPSDTESDDDDDDDDDDEEEGDDGSWATEEENSKEGSRKKREQQQKRPLRVTRASNDFSDGRAGKGAGVLSTTFTTFTTFSARHNSLAKQPVREVPLQEQEEEEIVALSSYLACAKGRGWPWSDKKVLFAEYVSLNGHHRWIRAEDCRHALLLVPGALYLLELPASAVTRHQTQGLITRARGSWYMRLDASDLSHVSVPLSTTEPERTSWRGTAALGSPYADLLEAGSGLIFHKRGGVGACAWVECRSAASRDALIDQVSEWAHAADTRGKGKGKGSRAPSPSPFLGVERCSGAHLSAVFGGQRRGRKMPSLTDERQACPLW